MMNSRVLELLKNPENIQSEDLHLLKEEINSFPYIQNIRALHLYGVHLFDKENYQKELSVTAAYTTDKKILYQLINGKIEQLKIEKTAHEVPFAQKEIQEISDPKEESLPNFEESRLPKHDYEAISESLITPKPEIKHIIVNGERNRILFEGEENFLEETETEKIDLESTLESGVIVIQKPVSSEKDKISTKNNDTDSDFEIKQAPSEKVINEDKIDSEKIAEKINNESELSFQKIESLKPENEIVEESSNASESSTETPEFETSESLNLETIINEDKIDSEKVAEKVNDESELSFHATDSFLPDIKIEVNNSEQNIQSQAPKSAANKHEDEMRRLIEEVEKKMKSQKKETEQKPEIEEEKDAGGEISFAETQAFHVGEEQKAAEEVVVKIAESIVEEKLEEDKFKEQIEDKKENVLAAESEKETISTWKPMSFESHTPDSFSRKAEIQTESDEKTKQISENILQEKNSEVFAENTSEKPANESETAVENIQTADSKEKAEVPVMNVSFFGNDISSLSVQKESEEPKEHIIKENKPKTAENKGGNLLDSNVPGFINTWQSWLKIDRTEEIEKSKAQTKNKVIESFIENNPKISQLKDEVNFVVKEKTDDISHLMTETLANLYIEQKLYTKAINAFKILVNKHPDRKEYFENKIQEIKDNRGKN